MPGSDALQDRLGIGWQEDQGELASICQGESAQVIDQAVEMFGLLVQDIVNLG